MQKKKKNVVIQGQPIPIKLANQHFVATNIELLINTTFQVAGIYWVEVLLEGDIKIRYPLTIMPPPPTNKSQSKEQNEPQL